MPFKPSQTPPDLARVSLEKALAESRFEPFYQLIYDPHGTVSGAEVLARLNAGNDRYLDSSEFLESARTLGMLPAIDAQLRSKAIAQAGKWAHRGMRIPLSINISSSELEGKNFASRLLGELKSAGLAGHQLSVEITEHEKISASPMVLVNLIELRQQGVHVVMDDVELGIHPDVGNNFNTPQMVRAMTEAGLIDGVKIDYHTAQAMFHGNREAGAQIGALLNYAHERGLSFTFEGIENAAQLEAVRALGCDKMQGYFLHQPAQAEHVGAHYHQARATPQQPRFAQAITRPSIPPRAEGIEAFAARALSGTSAGTEKSFF